MNRKSHVGYKAHTNDRNNEKLFKRGWGWGAYIIQMFFLFGDSQIWESKIYV